MVTSLKNNIEVTQADWAKDKDALSFVRINVFVKEQKIPLELEIEPADESAFHVLACVNNQPVGTGRLLPDGQIGRMAVVAEYRNLGIGGHLLKQLVEIAEQQGFAAVFLNAQQSAQSFYQAHGFEITGEPFDEVGIPHIRMAKKIMSS